MNIFKTIEFEKYVSQVVSSLRRDLLYSKAKIWAEFLHH